MSCNNDVVVTNLSSVFSSSVIPPSESVTEKSTNDFNAVMLKALENCNGKRPEHVCCCGESSVANSEVETVNLNEDNKNEVKDISVEKKELDANKSESQTAGSCFTMFVKISARITTEVGNVVNGKFKDTTLAFADALKTDKVFNENLLTTYMQKTEEKLAAQKEELKSFLTSYLDNMLVALRSSISGLNSSLLSSSNLLGSSLSNYSNILGNSNLFAGSSSSTILSGINSAFSNNQNSASLAGYSAIDAANVKVNALLNGNSGYTYGIGTTLNTNRYAGRNLELIRTADSGVGSVYSSGIKMVDGKGNSTTGVVSSGINIGTASAKTVANVSDNKKVAETIEVANTENAITSNVNIENTLTEDNVYDEALERKNKIVDMFKQMILSFDVSDEKEKLQNNGIKKIDADISISFV